MDELLAPFRYGFMQNSFLTAVLIGILCAVVGCYVVVRSMAFLGDALSHAVLPGVAIAYLTGGNLTIGALAAAVIVAVGISVLSKRGEMKEDSVIGIVFSAAFALGVALISSIQTYAVDLTHILFGNILGIRRTDLVIIALSTALIIVIIVLFYRYFLVVSFDPVLAHTLNWNVDRINIGLFVLIACTITLSIKTVGSGLVTAMLITPAATALMLTKRLPVTMLVSALFGAFSGVAGLYISYFINISSGASIVLVATFCFLVVYLIRKIRPFSN